MLKVNNKSAITLAKNPVFHERSKHIKLKYHFICDSVEAKKDRARVCVNRTSACCKPHE
jgi:hypothetical protein